MEKREGSGWKVGAKNATPLCISPLRFKDGRAGNKAEPRAFEKCKLEARPSFASTAPASEILHGEGDTPFLILQGRDGY